MLTPRRQPGRPWLLTGIGVVVALPLTVLGLMAATFQDAVLVVVAFGLWELWLIVLIVDWSELRSLLPPSRLRAPTWQGGLKVLGYGAAGLFLMGVALSLGESGVQRQARMEWRQGTIPAAFVLVPLPAPVVASLIPPAPPRPEEPLPGPPAMLPLQGPPQEAAVAQRRRDSTAAAAAVALPVPQSPPAPEPPPPPPPPHPDPNNSSCFGHVKAFATPEGRRLFVLATWPDFLRYAATEWFCTEADARRAGYLPGPH